MDYFSFQVYLGFYCTTFAIPFSLSLYSNHELQCHFTEKKNYRLPNKFKAAEAGRVFFWGRCGEGELQAVEGLWTQHGVGMAADKFIVLLNNLL